MPEDELPPGRLLQPATLRVWAAVMGPCVAYAVLRYHIAGGVEWRHFPLFIFNKTVAMSAVLFVGLSYLIGPVIKRFDEDKRLRLVVIKFCGLMGFFLAVIHAFFSVILLTPAYFAKYFDAQLQLNLQGELGMCLGVLGLFMLLAPALATLPMMPRELGGKRWKRAQRMGYISLLFVIGHLVVLGIFGWLAPSHWPWYIPPISLVTVLAAIIPVFVKRQRMTEHDAKKKAAESEDRPPPPGSLPWSQ